MKNKLFFFKNYIKRNIYSYTIFIFDIIFLISLKILFSYSKTKNLIFVIPFNLNFVVAVHFISIVAIIVKIIFMISILIAIVIDAVIHYPQPDHRHHQYYHLFCFINHPCLLDYIKYYQANCLYWGVFFIIYI